MDCWFFFNSDSLKLYSSMIISFWLSLILKSENKVIRSTRIQLFLTRKLWPRFESKTTVEQTYLIYIECCFMVSLFIRTVRSRLHYNFPKTFCLVSNVRTLYKQDQRNKKLTTHLQMDLRVIDPKFGFNLLTTQSNIQVVSLFGMSLLSMS